MRIFTPREWNALERCQIAESAKQEATKQGLDIDVSGFVSDADYETAATMLPYVAGLSATNPWSGYWDHDGNWID